MRVRVLHLSKFNPFLFDSKNTGFSLIEMIAFIVVVVIALGIFIPLTVIARYSHSIDQQSQALELAKKRMELILKQKKLVGFNSFSDPCLAGTPPAACSSPGYNVDPTTIASGWNGDANYKVVTVRVSGNGYAVLQTLVAKY
jgi:type II secretory pathway pseudopilin PulG